MANCTRLRAKNDYCIIDGIVFMALTKGQWTTLDEADLPLVANYRWHTKVSADGRTLYAASWTKADVNGKRHQLLMSRVIAGVTDRTTVVDHLNGKTLHNVRSNLRVCNSRQNNTNRARFAGSHGFKGVSKGPKSKSFTSRLTHDGVEHVEGKIPTAIEAAHVYDRLAVKYRGLDGLQPRSLNFPSAYDFLMWEIHNIDVSGSYGLKAA